MPKIDHAVTVTIDSIDRTEYLLKNSLFIRSSVRNQNDVCEFKLKNFDPPDGSEVTVSVDGTTIFGGGIVSKSAEVLGVKTSKVVFWEVSCKSWVEFLERSQVEASYIGRSDAYIINDLFTTYTTGFDASTYPDTLNNDIDISFTNTSLRGAIDQLAELVGADWYVDPDKNVRWFSPSNPDAAAFDIDCDSPNNTTTFDVLNNSLRYTVNVANIINRVIVNGGTKTLPEKVVDSFSADGIKYTFGPTDELIDSVAFIGYTDTDDNVYNTYGSFVGYAPDDTLVNLGGSYLALISADRKYITVEGNSGQAPKSGSTVDLQYYSKEPISITEDDLTSQSLFGVYSVHLNDQTFVDEADARAIAQTILSENAYGNTTLKFDITKFGLLPGTLIDVAIEELELGGNSEQFLLLENSDFLLLENGDKFLTQRSGGSVTFLIQEVSYIPTVTNQDEFMMVASVTCGAYQKTIIDSLVKVSSLRSNPGRIPQPSLTRLSNVSSNMGEVRIGRATFTDGGTAAFNWGTPNGATGVVVGLEDQGSNAYGAMYVYNNGTVQAKLGRLNDVPDIGTIDPSGWGIYTQNGYFSGVVAASQLIGNTVTGGTITGGTINGGVINGGTISGALINGNTIVGGTIATSTPPVNSSNPGVTMDSTGLYGYGTAGLTFRLSSDPAIKPWFSSGTITNTVYEINTAAVLRTGTVNPRVQIDNSGIFAWNSAGALKFTVDVATGKMTATDGTFSGTVSASLITGGTVSGGTITGAVFTGGTTTAGTISAARFTGGTIQSSLLTAGTVQSSLISGGTVTGSFVSGGSISLLSGSVTLGDDGIILKTPTTAALVPEQSIKYSYSGTIIGSEVTSRNSSISKFYRVMHTGKVPAGGPNGLPWDGQFDSIVWGTASAVDQSTLQQSPDDLKFFGSGSAFMRVMDGQMLVTGDIVSVNNNTHSIGNSGTAYTGIYLYDSVAGAIKRLRISNGTVLIT